MNVSELSLARDFAGGGHNRAGFAWSLSHPLCGIRRFAGAAGVLYNAAPMALSDSTLQSSDDVLLTRAVAAGDPEALRQLYERHSGMLFSLALKILGNRAEAEDVLQDTFVQAWKSAGAYDAQRSQPIGWLILLVRSRAIDRLRSRRTRGRTAEAYREEPVDDPPLPAQEAIAAEARSLVRQAMSGLPAEQRIPIELAYFGGFTQTEIAARLGQPLGTVKTRMRAGMLKLREQLGGMQ
jgi:RNA polymerase sigma-70 factor (ECF subfamily)